MNTLTNIREIQLAAEILEAEQGKAEFLANLNNETGCHLARTIRQIFEAVRPIVAYEYDQQCNHVRRKNGLFKSILKPAMATMTLDDMADTTAYILATILISKFEDQQHLTSIADALMRRLGASLNVHTDDATDYTVLKTCVALVRGIIENIPFIYIEQDSGMNGSNLVLFTEDKIEEIAQHAENIAEYAIKFMPMRCKPNPIKNLLSPKSGFLHHRSPFIKRPVKINKSVHAMLAGFNDETAPEFFEAINQHQNVSYQINKPLLNVLLELRDSGFSSDPFWTNLDAAMTVTYTECEQAIEDENNKRLDKYQDKVRYLSDGEMRRMHKTYALKAKQMVNKCNKLLDTAQELATWEEFYFPIFADNRARLYYYSNKINPQGSQLDKALLQFTGSVELNEDNIEDLYIALGNALGYGKKTLEYRIKKAVEFIPNILTGDWKEVMSMLDPDEMFTGLAICLDIKGYEYAKANGTTYQSHLPLHFDSCNSGSQINGLLLKDLRNCTLSNIIDTTTEDLADTYKAVADLLEVRMKEDQSGIFNKHLQTPEIFHRTVFKKSSMVRSNYAAGFKTCADDLTLQMKLMFRPIWDSWTPAERKIFLSSSVKVIDDSLPASNNFKKFASSLIKFAASSYGYFAYHQPLTGFPVVLREEEEITKNISYRELHTHIKKSFNYKTTTGCISVRKTTTSGVPSIVHSFDGAVVLEVRKIFGDEPMVAIHDSIGVLAGSRKKLMNAVNSTYHKIAINDYLQDIADQVGFEGKATYSYDLDTDLVLTSKHSFS